MRLSYRIVSASVAQQYCRDWAGQVMQLWPPRIDLFVSGGVIIVAAEPTHCAADVTRQPCPFYRRMKCCSWRARAWKNDLIIVASPHFAVFVFVLVQCVVVSAVRQNPSTPRTFDTQ